MLHRGARAAVEFAGERRLRERARRRRCCARSSRSTAWCTSSRAARWRGSARRSGCRPSPARSATSWCAAPSSPRTVATPTSPAPCTRSASRIAARRRAAVVVSARGHARAPPAARAHARAPPRTPPRVSRSASGLVLLEGSAQPGLVALAVGRRRRTPTSRCDGSSFSLARDAARSRRRGNAQAAFYLAAGPERDGAEATAAVLRRRGWRDAPHRHARRAPAARAEHRQRRDRPADQPQPAVRVLLWRGPRARRRALLSRAHARAVALPPASRCATGKR